ncbi:MAG: hypothetical protein LBU91_02205 [Bacteroidales bacterium]|jgi:hypothetical protein|nr:hypothetical protein [Bacteroidales bacterium]
MKAKTFFTGLLGSLLFICCAKEPPKLPEATQEGLSTFGCLVNGELVIYQKQYGFNPPKPYGELHEDGRFRLATEVEYGHAFTFYISNPQLGSCQIDSVFFEVYSKPYYYVARGVQQINFTKFEEHIASGTFTFEADAYDNQTHQKIPDRKIYVTKGRFDVGIDPSYWY